MLIALACLVAWLLIGRVVALLNDANNHHYAEFITCYDPARARRICQWAWLSDTMIWPVIAIGLLAAALARVMKWGA